MSLYDTDYPRYLAGLISAADHLLSEGESERKTRTLVDLVGKERAVVLIREEAKTQPDKRRAEWVIQYRIPKL
jgi:hypothetical protein